MFSMESSFRYIRKRSGTNWLSPWSRRSMMPTMNTKPGDHKDCSSSFRGRSSKLPQGFSENTDRLFFQEILQTTLRNFSVSALISFLFVLPFSIMEIVNRRNYNEEFPFTPFLALWINVFALSLILLPIVLSKRANKQGNINSNPVTGNSWLTNPKSSLIISVALILFIVIPSLLSLLGWAPMQELNTEYVFAFGIQVPNIFIAFTLFSFPIIAGYVASMPIVRTLQTGGGMFAHPIHLIIVVVLSFLFAVGVIGMIVDQWPCFLGVPNCD